MSGKKGTLAERWQAKVEKTETCWLWTGAKDHKGYGRIQSGARGQGTLAAHRVGYELAGKVIPDGMQLDHLCRVRHCVNPDHLEPVTNRENVLRGETLQAQNIAKETCPQGHVYDRFRTQSNGLVWRGCKRCHAAEERERQARLRDLRP